MKSATKVARTAMKAGTSTRMRVVANRAGVISWGQPRLIAAAEIASDIVTTNVFYATKVLV